MKSLKLWLESIMMDYTLNQELESLIIFVVLFLATIALLLSAVYITRQILYRTIGKLTKKTDNIWDDAFANTKVLNAISLILAVIILKISVPLLFEGMDRGLIIAEKLTDVFLVYVVIRIINVTLRVIEEILSQSQIFQEKPLASYFQLLRLIMIIIAIILSLSILMSKSPMYFLGTLGAMTAILLLIFKDTIMGFVTSVQITVNDIIRIGDYIEMPKFNAEGDVIALNLTTVKIRNTDKTISTIPTYYLTTESFKNWRGVKESDARRIKRQLRISLSSIRFVDAELLNQFKTFNLISNYVEERQSDINRFNEKHDINTEVLINGRRMTNIGVFRKYVRNYLEYHPGIRKDTSVVVRQLSPDEFGVPLEIYCFTSTTVWEEYEAIQSDIFDHLFAAARFFDLEIYQRPSGKDFKFIHNNQ